MSGVPLSKAESVAKDLASLIRPWCERLEIAGSIRRRCPRVNDVDLVVVPKIEVNQGMMFRDLEEERNILDGKIWSLIHQGVVLKQNGPKLKSGQYRGVDFDIFVATEETWWTTLLIRTGSKEHNIALCERARELGKELKANGDGIIEAGRLIRMNSERDIFEALDLPYLEPENRELFSARQRVSGAGSG